MIDLDKFISVVDGLFRVIAEGEGWQFFLFGAVFFAAIGIAVVLRPRRSLAERLGADGSRAASAQTPSLRRADPNTPLHQALKAIEKRIATDASERSATQLRMIHAGYVGDMAIRVYFVTRVFLAVTLPTVFLLSSQWLFPAMSTQKTALIAIALCGAGLYLPYRWVQSKIDSRRTAISNGFPDALDMLVVCVEAGLSLDGGLQRVADEIKKADPTVADELRLVALELRAGKSREQALTNLGVRSGVADVANFAAILIQSDALGADIAQALRVQADEMRSKRMLRAEEIAHKLPVKLSIPLVTCVLPALFAVVIGPGIISIVRNVIPHLGHH